MDLNILISQFFTDEEVKKAFTSICGTVEDGGYPITKYSVLDEFADPLQRICDFINELQNNIKNLVATRNNPIIVSEPSLPSDLDEAAEEALDEDFDANWHIDEWGDGCTEPGYNQKQMLLMFKAGAEWMAGQGCTVEVDEGYFINNPRNDRREGKFHKYYSSVFGHSKKITVTPGDNLIIQIRRSNPAKA